jgi:hypothetical protein
LTDPDPQSPLEHWYVVRQVDGCEYRVVIASADAPLMKPMPEMSLPETENSVESAL